LATISFEIVMVFIEKNMEKVFHQENVRQDFFGWLVGRPANQLVGWAVGWFIGWSIGQLVGCWSVGDWLDGWSISPSVIR
jgi:hypothetical protein